MQPMLFDLKMFGFYVTGKTENRLHLVGRLSLLRYAFLNVVFILIYGASAFGQDLEKITKKDIVKVGGGIGLSTTSYTAIGLPSNRQPFVWQLNMNMSLNILGVIDAPFSASFSNQSKSFNTPQPFNNFGISPKYKTVTLHLGYRSINLSEFSLSGSQFLGVGIEVTPKDFPLKGKALYGRFAKPVLFNPDGSIASMPSYARLGWGAGITLGKKPDHELTLNLFKAKDDASSLDIAPGEYDLRPADNFVIGLATKHALTKQISADGEFNVSMYTNDISVAETPIVGYSYINNLFFFQYNPTTQAKKAVMASVNYAPSFATFGLKYRRVDPEYKTLGTQFINNDYEDFTLNASTGIFKKKVNLTGSLGVQRNNLLKDKVSSMFRLANAVGVNYAISKHLNAAVNYANFSTNTHQTIVIDFDSLKFVQTTSSLGGNLTFNGGGEKAKHSFNLSANYQEAIVNEVRNTTMVNGNLAWVMQLPAQKINAGASVMALQNISETNTTTNIGPAINLGAQLIKGRLQFTSTGAFLKSYVDGDSNGHLINLALSGTFEIVKGQKIAFNVSDMVKNTSSAKGQEITATLNYRYSF